MNHRAPPLSILYAGTLPPHPGGSAISASQLIRGMARTGHRIRAIAPVTPETKGEAEAFDAANPELHIRRYPLAQYYTRVFQPRGAEHHDAEGEAVQRLLRRLGGEERPDIVFAGREMYAWYVPDAVEDLNARLLLRVAGGTLFGLVSSQYPDEVARDLITHLRRFDLLVTPAAYMARQLNAMGVTRTRTILNAIDLDRFGLRPPDEALRGALKIAPSDRVVLSIGNLHARKRSLDIVAAVERALDAEPRLLCVMLGSGPLRDDIESRIRGAGVEGRFRLPGWVSYDDVPRYLSLAEALVHAAEGEGLARAWLEAQAAGVPMVASDLEAIREVASDGETALLFPIGDVEGMADRLVQLLKDAALRERLSRNARRRSARHGLPQAVSGYVEAMRDLVAGPRGSGPSRPA